MQMYVNYFDHYVKTDTEAATVGMRELVIGRAARGYVALYHYVAAIDTAFVLAVRSQREVGFKR